MTDTEILRALISLAGIAMLVMLCILLKKHLKKYRKK